ncbi:MAG: hypothetical protein INR63_30115, partial [Actinomycetospora chiangmaiensis]|nr:hypothetical protein [Actinomycetospora chiangmaiensis]
MHCSSGEGEILEQHVREVHRLYLAALVRLDALEDEDGRAAGASESEYAAAQVDHELQFRILRVLLAQLGYVPRDLTTRSGIERDISAGLAVIAGRAAS